MLKNLLIWIGAFALSIISGAATIGAISKNRAPELALSLIPANGFAAETAAARRTIALIAKNGGEFPDRVDQSWNALAYQAFASEPIAPDAIAVIALSRTGDDRRHLMEKAFELSRRQQLVTGWMIMDSGVDEDIPAVLSYYDTTLRTSVSSADIIIPIMAKAIANDSFVKPFAEALSQNPPWAGRFWTQLVAMPDSIVNAADLREVLYKKEEQDSVYQDAALINALVYNRQFKKAEHLYGLLTQSTRKTGLVRNSKFVFDSKYPPIDWQLFSNGEYGASMYQGKLNLSAIRHSGGLVARQLVTLPNKVMMLRIEFTEDVPLSSNIFLELSCAENITGKPNDIRIPITERLTRKRISNRDALCRYYWLNIIARSVDDSDGFDVAIESISLRSE